MGYEKQSWEEDGLYHEGQEMLEMEVENLQQELGNLRIQLASVEQSRDQFKKLAAELGEALHEAVCGWNDIDSRIRYVEIQIDKDEMRHIYQLLGQPEPVFK